VRSDSFYIQNVQRSAGLSCKRKLYALEAFGGMPVGLTNQLSDPEFFVEVDNIS
jgi:hypothetical protein